MAVKSVDENSLPEYSFECAFVIIADEFLKREIFRCLQEYYI